MYLSCHLEGFAYRCKSWWVSVCAHVERADIQNGRCIDLVRSLCELLAALLCCFFINVRLWQVISAFICVRWAHFTDVLRQIYRVNPFAGERSSTHSRSEDVHGVWMKGGALYISVKALTGLVYRTWERYYPSLMHWDYGATLVSASCSSLMTLILCRL